MNAMQWGTGISMAPAVVSVVDDDVSVRETLESLIRTKGWQPLMFASAGEFLAVPRVAAPCCLLLDVTLPDIDGLDLQQRVIDRLEMPVIFITAHTDVQKTVRAMKAGAFDYLRKPLRDDVLLRTISFALERSQAVLSNESAIRRIRERYSALSRREREIMQLVASGWRNKKIGAALGICEITVKAHRSRLMRKMNAASLAELVGMAVTLGLANHTEGEWFVLSRPSTLCAAASGG